MLIVILPSKNEAPNIQNITQIVDLGLKQHFPHHKSLIINVDSSSKDDTVRLFKKVRCSSDKFSVVLGEDQLGKGFNIRKGIEVGLAAGGKHFVTIDTDVISANKNWIHSFFSPLINKTADYVVPIYKRNRYEGNTTNHFSSPIILACWNQHIVQPIAGDFGFNRALAIEILNNLHCKSDFQYGIDTVMTWTALSLKKKIYQIELGSKIHNPSFGKMREMFKQVAYSTFRQIELHKDEILSQLQQGSVLPIDLNVGLETTFISKPKTVEIKNLAAQSRNLLKHDSNTVEFNWVEKCCQTVRKVLLGENYNVNKLTEGLSPHFYLHILNYIEQILELPIETIEEYLAEQKKSFFNLMRLNETG